jgi:hypothetical protein
VTVTSRVEAVVALRSDVVGAYPVYVVALPPSTDDTPGMMRVDVNGIIITRPYDQTMEP